MREAEKDPKERKKRRLAEEELFQDGGLNMLDHNKKRKTVGRAVEVNSMGEGPSGLQGASELVRLMTLVHSFYLTHSLGLST